jgi:hypothetical protein
MISYEELTQKHKMSKEAIETALGRMTETDGLLLYQNRNFDSSLHGRQHLVIFGQGRTITEVERAPSWIDPDNCGGLPSRREQLVGEVDVTDARNHNG